MALGIIFERYTGFTDKLTIVFALVAAASLAASLFLNDRPENYLYWIFISLSFFISGALLFRTEREKITPLRPEDNLFVTEIIDFPQEKPNSWLIPAKIMYTIRGTDTTIINNGILLYQRKDDLPDAITPGDIIIVECNPLPIVNRGNPDEFDYRFYMESRGICYYSFINGSAIRSHIIPGKRNLKNSSLIIREKLINMYRERGIEGDRLAIVAALILGEKSRLDEEQKEIFIKAGVMHIMAVSGLHAGILSLFIFNLLFFMKRRLNILRVAATVCFLWFFAFVTGLTPSVLRATLMFSFLHAGNLMKRPVNGVNSILASAFILFIDNPYVLFDAGFLLSYSAVLFIVIFYQSMYRVINIRYSLPDYLWKSAAVTIVAQSGTLALSVMLFNRFPTWFLLSNLVIVPLSSAAIISGCLVPLFFPLERLSMLLAGLLSFLTDLTVKMTERAASLPYSTIENIGMTPFEALLLTAAIALLIRSLLSGESPGINNALAVVLIYCSVVTARTIEVKRSSEMFVFNTPGFSTVAFRSGNRLELFSDKPDIPDEVVRFCSTRRIKIGKLESFPRFMINDFEGRVVVFTDSLHRGLLQAGNIDLVVVSGRWPSLDEVTIGNLPPGCKIILSDASDKIAERISRSSGNDERLWFVRRDGAFRINSVK